MGEVSLDEPMANSSIVELAQHHRAFGPQIGRHGRFVARLEAVEDVAGGLGVHASVPNRSFMPSGMPSTHRLASGEPRVGGLPISPVPCRRDLH